MSRVGLLPPPRGCAVVEMGAGTGYLTLMLAEVWGGAHTPTPQPPQPPSLPMQQQQLQQDAAGLNLNLNLNPGAGSNRALGPIVLVDRRNFKNKV